MTGPTTTRKRRARRALLAVGIGLTFLVILLVFAPSLVSLGVGKGFIRGRLERYVNGTVQLGSLELGWSGPQSISGFEIADETGRTVVEADVVVNIGLLDLVIGSISRVDVTVSGSLRGDIEEDGTTSFRKLMRASPSSGGGGGCAGP